jgi:ABC-type phosphate transport system permease subunit
LPLYWVVLLSVSAAAGTITSVLISPAVGVPLGLAIAVFLHQVMV